MANDEVARAYQEYMDSGTPADTTAQQYTYYCSVCDVAPVAPTPPSVAHPTVVSFMPLPPQHVERTQNHVENPAVNGYSVGWQYDSRIPPPLMEPTSTSVRATVGSHGSRSVTDEIYEAKTKGHWQYSYYESPPPAPAAGPAEPASSPTIPVLLCHTCSSCGRMRSAGFHRSNPVIPGEDTIKGVCRRCRKKQRKEERGVRKVTHVRKCVADEPCDWPDKSIRIQIGRSESRGRRRNREIEEDYRYRRHRSTSPPRVVRRKESRHDVGVRALQPDRSPHRMMRRETEVRYSSPRPGRERIRIRHTTDYRRGAGSVTPPMEYMPPLREAFIPPPPMRHRARSVSLPRHREIDEDYGRDSQYRLAEHPIAYRSVHPSHRGFVEELDDDYAPVPLPARVPRITQSPSRGILKPSGMTRETEYRRRMSTHESQDSTRVEVGGPRVQFIHSSSRAPPGAIPEDESEHIRFRTKRGEHSGDQSSSEDFNYYHRRAETVNPYLDSPSTRRPVSPPVRRFEELHIRHVSPRPVNPRPSGSPILRADGLPRTQSEERRALDFEYRHIRRRSPPSPPHLPERGAISYRHSRSATPPSPPGRIPYRTIMSPALAERESELPILMRRGKDWDEVTASGSEEGDVVSVRTWRDRDENGKMTTFVEERATRAPLQGDSRKFAQHAAARSWRDV